MRTELDSSNNNSSRTDLSLRVRLSILLFIYEDVMVDWMRPHGVVFDGADEDDIGQQQPSVPSS